MPQDTYTALISKYLINYAAEIEVSSSMNFNDEALEAEQVFCEFLNMVYGYSLKSIGSPNTDTIDLADTKKGISIQVSCSKQRKRKFDYTVQQFKTRKLSNQYKKLIILFVTPRFSAPYLRKTKHKDFETEGWDIASIVKYIKFQKSDSEKAELFEYLQEKLHPKIYKRSRNSSANSTETVFEYGQGSDFNEVLLATKTANILVEIQKIKWEFSRNEKNSPEAAMQKITYLFSEHQNPIISMEVFDYLDDIIESSLYEKLPGLSDDIYVTILHFFPYFRESKPGEKLQRLAKKCINIAFSLVYDSIIKLEEHLGLMADGLMILNYVHKHTRSYNDEVIKKEILLTYKEIELTLDRVSFPDSRELLSVFQKDMDSRSESLPIMSERLFNLVRSKH